MHLEYGKLVPNEVYSIVGKRSLCNNARAPEIKTENYSQSPPSTFNPSPDLAIVSQRAGFDNEKEIRTGGACGLDVLETGIKMDGGRRL